MAELGATLPRGWYDVTNDLGLDQGGWPPPSLHLTASGDDSQLSFLAPAAHGFGRGSIVLALPRSSDRLYLDLGQWGDPKRLSWLKLRPISRQQAMLKMFSGLAPASGRHLSARRARWVIQVLVGLVRGQWRQILSGLTGTYQAALAMDLGAGAPASVLIRNTSLLPIEHEALFVPDDRCQLLPAGQPGEWDSSVPDPKLNLTFTDGCWPLPSGWYRIRLRLGTQRTAINSISLYAAFSPRSHRGESIVLGETDPEGCIDSIVLFRFPIDGLQLQLHLRCGRFLIQQIALIRLGAASALLRMIGSFPPVDGRRQVPTVFSDFIADVYRHGASRATALLKHRYDNEVKAGERSYARWVLQYDTFTDSRRAELESRAKRLLVGPLISVIVPVYETPEKWLRRCVESVIGQVYPNWELCLCDDASPSPHVREMLAEYAAGDDRIKVVRHRSPGRISAASNSALALASGEFIALLEHDDELTPNALLEVAETICGQPTVGLIYSDEDKIDEHGQRFDPYFKPDWNPELLRGQNYICHLTVFRASLLRDAGGFRLGFEGSQDHDLILRCTERLAPRNVVHVRRILYHSRSLVGPTAQCCASDGDASVAGAKAVSEHLVRIGADASVDAFSHGQYRIRWRLPSPVPRVSLIIPTRDNLALLRSCIDSILGLTTYPRYDLLIVDNQSNQPETLDYLAMIGARERVTVLRYDAPFNYSAINNWAARHTKGEVLGLVNDDIEVLSPDWLDEMASQAWRPDVGAVGAMLYFPDGRIQHAGVILGLGGIADHAYAGLPRGYLGHGWRARVCQNLSAVTAACLLVRRDVFEQVGGLDEKLRVAFNDIDFCLRVKEAGYLNVWTPFAELYHHQSASRGAENSPEKLERFLGEVALMEGRWGGLLRADPAYNPNLTLTGMDFAPAFPPRG